MVARMVWLLVIGICWIPASVSAQDEVADELAETQPSSTDAPLGIETIRQRLLETEVELDLVDVPLHDVAEYLGEVLKVPVTIDARALEDVGLGTDVRISLQQKAKARTAMWLIFDKLDLTYMLQPGRIVITTPETADATLRTAFYSVDDLVTSPGAEYGPPTQSDFAFLMDLIVTFTQPDSWDWLGGPGSINAYRGEIVINQTDEIHYEVEHLLQALRKVKALQDDDSRDAHRVSVTAGAEDQLEQKLAETRVTLTLVDTPLVDLLEILRTEHDIPVHLDRSALKNTGKRRDLPLNGQWKEMPLRTILDDLLEPEGLVWYTFGEMLVIVSNRSAKYDVVTKVYPVGDLQPKPTDGTSQVPRYASADGYKISRHYHELLEVIKTQVDSECWEQVGGPGSIALYEPGGALVVSQLPIVHRKIDDLLRKIRERSAAREGELPADVDQRQTTPVTITYQAHAEEGKPTATPEDLQTVARRIPQVIAPDSWQEEAHYIDALSDRLIVSQTPTVHRAIEEYFHQTGIIAGRRDLSPHGFGPSAGPYATDGVYPKGGSGIWPSCHGNMIKMLPRPQETGPETAQPTEAQPQGNEPNHSVLNPKEPRPADPSSEFDPFADPFNP